MLKGFTRRFKPLEILTEEQVEEIHRATLDVLRETGVRFESGWALDFLKQNGCEVDFEEKRVRFPEGLVEESLRKCPSSFRLGARDPKNDLRLGGNTVYFTQSAGMQTVDLDTYEPRPATRAEYIEYVRILDALPNVHSIMAYPYFGFEGAPPVMAIPEGVAVKTRYSGKNQQAAYSNDSEIFNIRMAKAAGAEIVTSVVCVPPLTWQEDAVSVVRRMTEAGFPLAVADGNMQGATAPATFAGALVTCNAELMSMIVLVQLLDPGHRLRVAHLLYPQDMRSGSPGFGQIGCSLSNVMFNQLWREYGVPISNGTPGYPSSKAIDYQTGYEKALGAILAALSGAHLIVFHGGVCGELSAHPVQAILDDDVAGMVGRFIEGIEVTAETLALELIEEVGPVPGHYLGTAHTRKWWLKEQFMPRAADRLTYPEWIRSGKKRAIDYAKKRMEEILATHRPMPLTAGQEQAIEDVLREARLYYRRKGLISDDEWRIYMRTLDSSSLH